MEILLSIIREVALTFFKVIVTDVAKNIMTRLKERTAPGQRDGSDSHHK